MVKAGTKSTDSFRVSDKEERTLEKFYLEGESRSSPAAPFNEGRRSKGKWISGVGGGGKENAKELKDTAKALIWGLREETEEGGAWWMVSQGKPRIMWVLRYHQAKELLEDISQDTYCRWQGGRSGRPIWRTIGQRRDDIGIKPGCNVQRDDETGHLA